MTAFEKANQWLHVTNMDEESKEEIKLLLKNSDKLDEAFLENIEFGTGGIRGIMGIGTNRMNKYTVGMATQGFANYLKKKIASNIKIAIAYDSRNNSKLFAQTTANIFAANDITVYLFKELRPTPELSFAVRHLGCHGGVVITASHNPKEYNGYKVYWSDGGQLVPPHDKKIMKEILNINSIDSIKFVAKNELIHFIEPTIDEAYLKTIKGLSISPKAIEKYKDLKIVFSSIHGTGTTMIPRTLAYLGFTNVHEVEEQSKPDGNFPTVIYPNPEEKEAMTLALEKAKVIDADLILATDPDADRVGIGVKNSKGDFQLLNGNQTGVLLIYYLLKKGNEKGFKGNEYIAKTIVTTELIRDIATKFDVKCYDTLTGFKWIADLIQKKEGKERFIGGGEESYGYLIGEEVRDKDAVASSVLLAEITAWAKTEKLSIFDLLIRIYQEMGFYYEELQTVTKKGLKGKKEIERMMNGFRTKPPKKLGDSKIIGLIDYYTGYKLIKNKKEAINFPKSNALQYLTEDNSKVSIRPSGTEAKIKFYYSVKMNMNEGDYFELEEKCKNKIRKLHSDLNKINFG